MNIFILLVVMNRNCILLCSDTTSNSLADGHSNSVDDTTMDEGGNHSGVHVDGPIKSRRYH